MTTYSRKLGLDLNCTQKSISAKRVNPGKPAKKYFKLHTKDLAGLYLYTIATLVATCIIMLTEKIYVSSSKL